MKQNSKIRAEMHQAAEDNHRAGRAWRQAGYQLLHIMQLYHQWNAAERENNEQERDRIREEADCFAAGGIAVQSGWTAPSNPLEAEHWRIDLSGGGPAVRLVGNFAQHGYATDAELQYQDWGTPWLEFRLLNDIERKAVSWYANTFYWPGA
jgi:hypothetical protein